jgi:uncharacterized membrane protein YkoI
MKRGDSFMMMRKDIRLMLFVGLGAALGTGSRAAAQEVEIALNQVPKAVIDAAKAKFPGGEIKEASKETEDGKTVFELEMKHDRHNMDVTFRDDGTLVLVETALKETEIPEIVMKAVKEKYPDAKLKLAESVKKGPEVKKEVDYYEFHLTLADKKTAEVEVDPHGKILKSEEAKAKEKEEDEDKEKKN